MIPGLRDTNQWEQTPITMSIRSGQWVYPSGGLALQIRPSKLLHEQQQQKVSFQRKVLLDNQPAFQRGLSYGSSQWMAFGVLHAGPERWWWPWVAHGSNPLSICVLPLSGISCYGWTTLLGPSFSESFLNFESWLLHWQKFCFPHSREMLHFLLLSRLLFLLVVSQWYGWQRLGFGW